MTSSFIFEGSEKKLEVVFALDAKDSLRFRPRSFFEKLVAASDAQILSEMSTLDMDAYLLSESSLFVFRDRIIMITCGRTRLIQAFQFLMEQMSTTQVTHVFFERKNENFPEAQRTQFEEDVHVLKTFFPNGQVHDFSEKDLGSFLHLFQWGKENLNPDHAKTTELLMHDLDAQVLEELRTSDGPKRAEWSRKFHLSHLFPNFLIDEFWFDPCGYSMNGIQGAHYFTIHVTPEPEASYISLETNVPFRNSNAEFKRALQSVLQTFKPKKSMLIQFRHPNDKAFLDQWTHPQFRVTPFIESKLDEHLQMHFNCIEWVKTERNTTTQPLMKHQHQNRTGAQT